MNQAKIPTCFTCHKVIAFDPNRRGKNGKMIPLNPTTMNPHNCNDVEEPVAQEISSNQGAVTQLHEKSRTDLDNLYEAIADLKTNQLDTDSHVIGLLAYIKTLTDTTYGADVTDRVTVLAEENAQLKIALKQLQKEAGYKNAGDVK